MKECPKNFEALTGDEIVDCVENILITHGKKALELARKEVLQEKVESTQVQEALQYFMTKYWGDVTRPALMSLICEAVGGNSERLTPISASIILISGAVDIHDDIIDKSETKNSRQTVFGKFGNDIALLVGDALYFKGFTLLYQAIEKGFQPEVCSFILDTIKTTFFDMGDAEACELKLRGKYDVSPEEYIRISTKKAADVEAYAKISAVLGGGTPKQVNDFSEFGRLLGTTLILRDDLLDLIDFKELTHRIHEEHLPLPMLYALQNPIFAPKLKSIITQQIITEKDADELLEIIEKSESFKKYRTVLEKLTEQSLKYLNEVQNRKNELELITKSILLPLDDLKI
jgi:geranylgeranyl pyrophosphate synthase